MKRVRATKAPERHSWESPKEVSALTLLSVSLIFLAFSPSFSHVSLMFHFHREWWTLSDSTQWTTPVSLLYRSNNPPLLLWIRDFLMLVAADEQLLTLPKVFPIIDRAIREGRGRPGHPGGPRLYHESKHRHTQSKWHFLYENHTFQGQFLHALGISNRKLES